MNMTVLMIGIWIASELKKQPVLVAHAIRPVKNNNISFLEKIYF